MKTYVYIDGFNLYYGALKNTQYKWLNIEKLLSKLLKKNNILKIRYFTADVSSRFIGDETHQRQQIYFKAIKTIPTLEIHKGHYLSHKVSMPLVKKTIMGKTQFAQVIKTEEKGSDVNLASYLLLDAFYKRFECAVIVSNDSDLCTPIKMVRKEFNKKIGILNPHRYQSQKLRSVTHFYKPIREGALRESQFLDPIISDEGKTIKKPPSW